MALMTGLNIRYACKTDLRKKTYHDHTKKKIASMEIFQLQMDITTREREMKVYFERHNMATMQKTVGYDVILSPTKTNIRVAASMSAKPPQWRKNGEKVADRSTSEKKVHAVP